jgi:hypothetical protein
MSYFYNDVNGKRQGQFNVQQLQVQVSQRVITPTTLMEMDTGQRGLAWQISGLFTFSFTDANGSERTINFHELRTLASQGIITPETPLETGGIRGYARQLPGLKFETVEILKPGPSPDTPDLEEPGEIKQLALKIAQNFAKRITAITSIISAQFCDKFSIKSASVGFLIGFFDGFVILMFLGGTEPTTAGFAFILCVIVGIIARGFGLKYPGIVILLLRFPRRKIKSADYRLYLDVLEALKENGYELFVRQNSFNIKRHRVSRNGNNYGYVFVVADRTT